jgi:hypothetical protein
MRTREIAGQIMGQLEAFEGSKAAMDTTDQVTRIAIYPNNPQ